MSGGGPAGPGPGPPQLSIPLSRFNNNTNNNDNNGVAVGHRRHMSETGSFTQIWSEGRRELTRKPQEAAPNARLTLGQNTRPGRDYSKYVAPVRRGSAA